MMPRTNNTISIMYLFYYNLKFKKNLKKKKNIIKLYYQMPKPPIVINFPIPIPIDHEMNK